MYKTGDKLKVNLAVAEAEYLQWKGSQVYTNMMKAAEDQRFEVLDDKGTTYSLKRSPDGLVLTQDKSETHKYLVIDN